MIKNGTISYIFLTDNKEISETVQNLITKTGVNTITLNTISSLSEANRKDNKDYITLMNENIELLKQELYD